MASQTKLRAPRRQTRRRLSAWLAGAAFALPAVAAAQFLPQGPSADPDGVHRQQLVQAAEQAWPVPKAEAQPVLTRHRVATPAGTIAYTAKTGALTIRDVNAKPIASIFYVAYTADGKPPGSRPITFLYNGGPGTASIWLHMGSFGPVRVASDTPDQVAPPPHDPLQPNPDTLLDKTDLVFIDAVGTGYSRPLGETPARTFWSVDADADAFARAILEYLAQNDRWSSPKFLMGESYGTARSAVLANLLQERGVALNGVVLLSSFLNYGMLQSGYDRDAIAFLPTYAAVGWFYHLTAASKAGLAEHVEQARAFAEGPYAAALDRGALLDPATRTQIARRMAELTGLSEQFIVNSNLRVDITSFRKELLRDKGVSIGRDDARYLGVDSRAAGEAPDFDASHTAIYDAYFNSFQRYLAADLGYRSPLPYLVAAYAFSDFKWDNTHLAPDGTPQPVLNATLDLAAAMRANRDLKVLSLNGYYDLATPFANTEYDLRHMMLPPTLTGNISYAYYPSGHMAYLDPAVRRSMHADIASFIDHAVAAATAAHTAEAGADSGRNGQ
jgi:carboxypeptidase C (cathepsin A)